MAQVDVPARPAGAAHPRGTRGRDGFIRADRDESGRWWLLDPQGQPFFLRAVHGVAVPLALADQPVAADPAARLRNWNFNALGAGCDPALRADGLPFLDSVEFCSVAPLLVAPGLRLPDVFDPAWTELAVGRARETCAPLADSRELIGWITDGDLDWAHAARGGRPSLLQLCLGLEPGYAAYHAAWEFVLAHHHGRLDAVAAAWETPLTNKEVLRELTRAERGLRSRGYLRDEARWVREFARRYFTVAVAAIRQADPNHLVLGCRFRHSPGAAVFAECTYPAIDVTLSPWTDLPGNASGVTQPLLADALRWSPEPPSSEPPGGRAPRLTSFERMLRKSRAGLDRLARHPAVVGYTWAQWQDEPGEQPPFAGGLVHLDGREAREHTELLGPFNLRAEHLRHQSR